jgi:hypothetical protein
MSHCCAGKCGAGSRSEWLVQYSPAAMFSIPVLRLFCCNETRITIFPGTCAALAYLG